MIIVVALVIVLCIAAIVFIQQPKFGRAPRGKRLETIQRSPHYRDGAFCNLEATPVLTEGVNYFTAFKDYLFAKNRPSGSLPSTKTDLKSLNPSDNVLVWLGHSSYYLPIDGKKILVDPVLCGSASPLAFTAHAFKGTDRYSTDDIPAIDYLLMSHDHWDHLDYETLIKLKPRIGKVICGLGVGECLEYWGFDTDRVIEKDWGESVTIDSNFTVHIVPARHFSGRLFLRNKTLWVSFVLVTPSARIFLGGDCGYDSHFTELGRTFGGFDLAVLPAGQYDRNWKYIHMTPEEALQAAKDLRARRLLPGHFAKFPLANHAWDEPLRRIAALSDYSEIPILTPRIGEKVDLNESNQRFTQWWEGIK